MVVLLPALVSFVDLLVSLFVFEYIFVGTVALPRSAFLSALPEGQVLLLVEKVLEELVIQGGIKSLGSRLSQGLFGFVSKSLS